ncbi:MAG: hypothetical protein EOM02_10940 [Synergistales bacterium]|nr:hypothetical protein [Synergistales bacterium]
MWGRALRQERDALSREVLMARELILVQEQTIGRLMAKITRLSDENSSLKEDMAELESRLGGFVSEAV